MLAFASSASAGSVDALASPITRANVSTAGTQDNGLANEPSAMSSDGRYVVFESSGSNLVTADVGGHNQIYLRDRTNSTTTLVSAESDGTPGNGNSDGPSISADGRYVVFYSEAVNLLPGPDGNSGNGDVFRKDLQTGDVVLVSASTGGTQGGSSSSPSQHAISDDGNLVVFQSGSTNLVGSDTNGVVDIFVKNLTTSDLVRVNVDDLGVEANSYSGTPSISGDGNYVVFESNATNLVLSDSNAAQDFFRKNLNTQSVKLVNTDSSGTQANNQDYGSVTGISNNGRYVVFASAATNLVASDNNGIADVFLKDMNTDATTRVSTDKNGNEATCSDGTPGNCWSYSPAISSDGSLVTFTSGAKNLVPGDVNNITNNGQIFLKNITNGKVKLLTATANGAQALPNYSSSEEPSISADGLFVVFRSDATNLVANDTNDNWDAFVKATTGSTPADPPVNTVTPVASGTAKVGKTLTTDQGTWTGQLPMNFTYQWQNCDGNGNNCTDLTGETATTLILRPRNVGHKVRVVVTVTNELGSVNKNSAVSGVVQAQPITISHGAIERVNVSSTPSNTEDNQGSFDGRYGISANGRYAVFSSYGDNLAANDNNNDADIFLRDRNTDITTLVSTSSNGTQANSGSDEPSITRDGRYVVFHSYADNLVSGDTNNIDDIFRKDLQTGTTVMVDTDAAGAPVNDNNVDLGIGQTISNTGRYVVFTAWSSTFVPNDNNGPPFNGKDVFRKDLNTGAIVRANLNAAGDEASSGNSGQPMITGDAQYVAFDSTATNLVSGDTNGVIDEFRKDMNSGAIVRVNTDSNGSQSVDPGILNGSEANHIYGGNMAITPNGRYIVFASSANDLVSGDTNAGNCDPGNLCSYGTDIFRKDLQTGDIVRVDTDGNNEQVTCAGIGDCAFDTSMSDTGNLVTFSSSSPDLYAGDDPAVTAPLFMKNIKKGIVTVLSANVNGVPSNGFFSTLSGDGTSFIFRSDSSDLVPGDTNGTDDVFVDPIPAEDEDTPPAPPESPPPTTTPPTTDTPVPLTPLVVTLTKTPKKLTTKRTASFGFKSLTSNATFYCRLDHQKYKRCTSPKKYRRLKAGARFFRVYAKKSEKVSDIVEYRWEILRASAKKSQHH